VESNDTIAGSLWTPVREAAGFMLVRLGVEVKQQQQQKSRSSLGYCREGRGGRKGTPERTQAHPSTQTHSGKHTREKVEKTPSPPDTSNSATHDGNRQQPQPPQQKEKQDGGREEFAFVCVWLLHACGHPDAACVRGEREGWEGTSRKSMFECVCL
jgi:hypothetical protein